MMRLRLRLLPFPQRVPPLTRESLSLSTPDQDSVSVLFFPYPTPTQCFVREKVLIGVRPRALDLPSGAVNQQPQTARGRWDEIRAANARNSGKASSWDVLREQHERERVSSSSGNNDASSDPSSFARTPSTSELVRAAEQARFDALLEAERKLSSS